MRKFKSVFSSFIVVFLSVSGTAFGADCKTSSGEGWGLTQDMAKWQANDMLLFSTGNLLQQTDRFSKPKYNCSYSVLGWSCTATAKVCKK